jgi:hypothetical protein
MLTTDQLARLLLDEDRLAILGCAARRPCSVDELADAITGKRASLARHLAQLTEAGLLSVSGSSGHERYTLDVAAIQALKQTLFARPAPAAPATPEEKVLASFVREGRLTHVPVQYSKRQVVLHWLAGQFDPDRTYSEREVNDMLASHGEDHASLRRYLVDAGLLTRSAGIYRRVPASAGEPQP